MREYYKDSYVTLYHGDWREVAPSLSGVDLVLADPPYGVSLNTEYRKASRSKAALSNDYPRIAGDDEPFDPTPFLSYPGIVLWGANYYADRLPPRGSWLVWDKRDGLTPNDQANAELAQLLFDKDAEIEMLRENILSVRDRYSAEFRRLQAEQLTAKEASVLLQLESDAAEMFEQDILKSAFAKLRSRSSDISGKEKE